MATGSGAKVELVTIKKITDQTVAGRKYDITGTFKVGTEETECVVIIWHRAWLDDVTEKTKLKATCGSEVIHAANDDGAW